MKIQFVRYLIVLLLASTNVFLNCLIFIFLKRDRNTLIAFSIAHRKTIRYFQIFFLLLSYFTTTTR